MKNAVETRRNEGTLAAPARELTTLQRGIDRLFEDFMMPWRGDRMLAGGEAVFLPAVDVEERDDAYLITLDVPGVKKEDIKIELNDNQLTVSGERKYEKSEKKRGSYFTERSFGRFTRSFSLPSGVLADKIQAEYRDGELKIAVPKGESHKARTVEIGVGDTKETKDAKDLHH